MPKFHFSFIWIISHWLLRQLKKLLTLVTFRAITAVTRHVILLIREAGFRIQQIIVNWLFLVKCRFLAAGDEVCVPMETHKHLRHQHIHICIRRNLIPFSSQRITDNWINDRMLRTPSCTVYGTWTRCAETTSVTTNPQHRCVVTGFGLWPLKSQTGWRNTSVLPSKTLPTW